MAAVHNLERLEWQEFLNMFTDESVQRNKFLFIK